MQPWWTQEIIWDQEDLKKHKKNNFIQNWCISIWEWFLKDHALNIGVMAADISPRPSCDINLNRSICLFDWEIV